MEALPARLILPLRMDLRPPPNRPRIRFLFAVPVTDFRPADVIHHFGVNLLSFLVVPGVGDQRRKGLHHVAHPREAERARRLPRGLRCKQSGGTHQVVAQHRHVDFLRNHFHASAGELL